MTERSLREKEQQLQAVMEMSQAGILMTDAGNWTISFANSRMAEMVGYGLSELQGASFFDFIHLSDVELVKFNMHMLVTGELSQISSERRFLRKDGTQFPGLLAARPVLAADGSFNGVVVTIYDVSERHESEKILSQIVSNYWEIFNATNDALFVHDAYSGAIVEVNKTVERMYGYTREEIFFMSMNDFSSGEPPYSQNEAVRWIRKAVEEGPQTYEWLARKKRGDLFWAEISLTASHIGGEGRVLAVIRDISDRKEIEKRLQYLSAHDSLTGLYNRLFFETQFERISKGRKYPVSIIVADLDGLKSVNDTLGHAVGDTLIKAAADVLKDSFRPDDLVARIGGDEFAVLVSEADEKVIANSILRIRQHEREQNSGEGTVKVSFSLGAATACRQDEMDAIFNKADMLMYQDKAVRKGGHT